MAAYLARLPHKGRWGLIALIHQEGWRSSTSPPTLVKPLKRNPTIFKFKIRAIPQTLQGTLTVAASLGEATQGVRGEELIRPLRLEHYD